MDERAVRRVAAIAGIAFVVLLIVSIVLTIPAPMPNKSAAKIVKWFADHRGAVFTSNVLGGLSTVVFLWFLGYLHHRLSDLAGGARALSSIVLTSGVATVTIATLSGLPFAALAVTASRPGVTPSEGVVHMLADLNGFGIALIGFGLTVFLAALGLELAQGAIGPRWASWAAYVGAILNLVGSVAGFFVSKSGKGNPAGIAGLIGLVLFLVTVVAISADLFGSADAPA
jgi:hypothetical protein